MRQPRKRPQKKPLRNKKGLPGMKLFCNSLRVGLTDLCRWLRDLRHCRSNPVDEVPHAVWS